MLGAFREPIGAVCARLQVGSECASRGRFGQKHDSAKDLVS